MLMFTLNDDQWNKYELELRQLIRALKAILREPHQSRKYCGTFRHEAPKGMAITGCTEEDLLWAKKVITKLYMERAHQRGRVHRKGDTLESQTEALKATATAS